MISSQVHYTKGGKPGYYPPIKGRVGGQIQFNLYDPFNWFPEQGAESKARGLKSEILNGRAAMIGIMGFCSEAKVPGSVPFVAVHKSNRRVWSSTASTRVRATRSISSSSMSFISAASTSGFVAFARDSLVDLRTGSSTASRASPTMTATL